MRIRKFSDRFKQSYRALASMMIAASLLGISYGYWSDESIIRAQINIPQIEVKDKEANYQLRSSSIGQSADITILKGEFNEVEIADHQKVYCEDERLLRIVTEIENPSNSRILIEYDSCELYFIDRRMPLEGEEGFSLKNVESEVYIAKETSKGSGVIEIQLMTSKFADVLTQEGIFDQTNEGTLRIVMNFKQVVEEGEKGWEYPVKRDYTVEFIEPETSPIEDTKNIQEFSKESAPIAIWEGDLTPKDSEELILPQDNDSGAEVDREASLELNNELSIEENNGPGVGTDNSSNTEGNETSDVGMGNSTSTENTSDSNDTESSGDSEANAEAGSEM